MPDPQGYDGDGGAARWGCGAAAVFLVVVVLPMLFFLSLSDCATEACRARDKQWDMMVTAAILLALAALFGFAVRAILAWRARGAGRPPVWAFLVAVPLGLLLLWAAWGVLSLFLP